MKEENRRSSSCQLLVRRALGLFVGAVFVYAGSVKLVDPLRFATDISNYQLLSWPIAVRLAFYLPWLEVLCGLALIFHRLFAGAVFLTGGLMLIFIAATVTAKGRGIDVACGCFGNASNSLTLTWHLALNGGLLAVLLFLWLTREAVPAARRL